MDQMVSCTPEAMTLGLVAPRQINWDIQTDHCAPKLVKNSQHISTIYTKKEGSDPSATTLFLLPVL